MIEIAAESTMFLPFTVDSPDDLSTGTVEVGYAVADGSRPTSWHAGVWDGTADFKVLYSSGTLTPGVYETWARIIDSPETIITPAGLIRVI
jgi:hypothetical protein